MLRVGFHSTPRIDLAGGIEGGVVALFKLYHKIKAGVVELLAISLLNPCLLEEEYHLTSIYECEPVVLCSVSVSVSVAITIQLLSVMK